MYNKKYKEDFDLFCSIWRNQEEINALIYDKCYNSSENTTFLWNHFVKTQVENDMAFSELAFRYAWLIILNQLPVNAKLLEIGVFKGGTISLFRLISNHLKNNFEIFGLTPLSSTGDKFSNYQESDFLQDIEFVHSLFELDVKDLNLYKGLSTDGVLKTEVRKNKFDLVYIDGSHDYDCVINDIDLTDEILNVNGFMITDDSSSGLSFPSGFIGFRGHTDVFLALQQSEIVQNKYQHLFACGHIRCWKKIK